MINILATRSNDVTFFLFLFSLAFIIFGLPLIFRKKVQQIAKTRPLLVYSVRRVIYALITLFLIVTVIFLLLRMFPKSNYIDWGIVNKYDSEFHDDIIKRTFAYYGLDKPIWQQLYNFYKNIFPFPKDVCFMTVSNVESVDAYNQVIPAYTPYCSFKQVKWINLGVTQTDGYSILDLITSRAPISFSISFPIAFLSMLIGYPMGIMMAKNRGKMVDQIGIGIESVVMAIPVIVLYGLLRMFFLSSGVFSVVFDAGNILTYVPPIASGVLIGFSAEAYYIRRYIVDQMNNDYVKFARAKGLSENRIMFTHVFRNALVHIIRYIPGTIIGSFVGGYFLERLYNIPGMGALLVESLNSIKPDNNMVQGLTLIYAVMSLTAYLLADLIVVLADPRISYTKNK